MAESTSTNGAGRPGAQQGGQTSDEARAKLWSLIGKIGVAMMTTEDGDVLRSRPMAAVDRNFDGTLWFFTRSDSAKVSEVAQRHRVGLSYADPSAQNYVSLSGLAEIIRDRAAIDEHWSESVRTWFPHGKDDPAIALLKVEVVQGEYWDAPSGTMLHLFGYAKAVLTGRPPHPGDHATVSV